MAVQSEIERSLRSGNLDSAQAPSHKDSFLIHHYLVKEQDEASPAQVEISFLNDIFTLKPGEKRVFKDIDLTLRAKLTADGPGTSLVVSIDEMPFMSATAFGSRLIPLSDKSWQPDFSRPGAVVPVKADIEVSLIDSNSPRGIFGTLKAALVGSQGAAVNGVLGKPVESLELIQLRSYREPVGA